MEEPVTCGGDKPLSKYEHLAGHTDFAKRLHEKGCEFGRTTAKALETLEIKVAENHQDCIEEIDSKFVSTQAGAKMMADIVTDHHEKATEALQSFGDAKKLAIDLDKKYDDLMKTFNALPFKLLGVNGATIGVVVVLWVLYHILFKK